MFNLAYPLARCFLFRLDAEKTHDLTLASLKFLQRRGWLHLIRQPLVEDPVTVFGLDFPNRIGLAAGLDKNGECIDAFAALGFGHIEVGTVTPRPQAGNDRPRLFRLPAAKALINRFGFNNLGVDQLVENVKAARFDGVLGINIGKNFDTPVEDAIEDYLIGMRKVFVHASYVTINISSPNTANLRQLQFGEALDALLEAIKKEQASLESKHGKRVPMLVKIAPDLEPDEIDQLAEKFLRHKVDGVIATNTTFSRAGAEALPGSDQQGGMSGAPLLARSNQVVELLVKRLKHEVPVIGVGGIVDAKGATQKISAGASLVQIYSGLIYQGPTLITQIATRLAIQ